MARFFCSEGVDADAAAFTLDEAILGAAGAVVDDDAVLVDFFYEKPSQPSG